MSLVRDKDRQTSWHRTAEIGDVRTSGSRRQFIDSCFLASCRLFVLLHHLGLGVCGNVQQWHCEQYTHILRPMWLLRTSAINVLTCPKFRLLCVGSQWASTMNVSTFFVLKFHSKKVAVSLRRDIINAFNMNTCARANNAGVRCLWRWNGQCKVTETQITRGWSHSSRTD